MIDVSLPHRLLALGGGVVNVRSQLFLPLPPLACSMDKCDSSRIRTLAVMNSKVYAHQARRFKATALWQKCLRINVGLGCVNELPLLNAAMQCRTLQPCRVCQEKDVTHPDNIVADVAHGVSEGADEHEVAAQPVETDALVEGQHIPQRCVPAAVGVEGLWADPVCNTRIGQDNLHAC